jgi:hypothetical protein
MLNQQWVLVANITKVQKYCLLKNKNLPFLDPFFFKWMMPSHKWVWVQLKEPTGLLYKMIVIPFFLGSFFTFSYERIFE